MPNLVVYVPTKLWKRIEETLGAEWPAWARKMTVRHIEEFLESGAADVAASSVQPSAAESPRVSAPEPSTPRKRFHPCKHHVPPSRICDYCDWPDGDEVGQPTC